jgi:hypothetical protein
VLGVRRPRCVGPVEAGQLAVSRSHRTACRSGGGTSDDRRRVRRYCALCRGAGAHARSGAGRLPGCAGFEKRGRVRALDPERPVLLVHAASAASRVLDRHLSTDRFLDRREAIGLLQFAGLRLTGSDFWTFIPKADMPRWTGVILESPGSRGPHLPPGCMSRGPHSYRHQRRLITLSIAHWGTFAMADTRSAVGQEKDVPERR